MEFGFNSCFTIFFNKQIDNSVLFVRKANAQFSIKIIFYA